MENIGDCNRPYDVMGDALPLDINNIGVKSEFKHTQTIKNT